METLAQMLRRQAKEIADAGHYGWGNTMQHAADHIDRLEAQAETAIRRIESLERATQPTGG